MRRAAPTMPISPKLIRQFALITLIGTALLAMFANGEQDQFQEELRARAEKNRLLKAEAEAVGRRKLIAKQQIANEQSGEGYEKLNGSPEPGRPSASGGYSGGGTVVIGTPPIPPNDPRWAKVVQGDRAKWYALQHKQIRRTPKKLGEVPVFQTEPGLQSDNGQPIRQD